MSVTDQLDRLAALEPAPYPVVSLYLNTQPGPTGKDQFQTFVKKELPARSRTYPANSPERVSLDADLERISKYLSEELKPSANGVAIFACSAGELFEAVQLTAPIDRHWLYIGDHPHLYPLARVESLYPRYAAVLADTNSARILVVATGELVDEKEIKNVKTRRTSQGGWSQARYQRHIENFHQQHAKEVVDVLDNIVRREGIEHIVLAGDEVITPLLREQLPKQLADLVADEVRLDRDAPIDQILRTSLEAMKRSREQTEQEKVSAAIDAYRAGGLGIVGPEETLVALVQGQVEELLLTVDIRRLEKTNVTGSQAATTEEEPIIEPVQAGEPAEAPPEAVQLADALVIKAAQTNARITFIENRDLLADYGGVAALLRFRI